MQTFRSRTCRLAVAAALALPVAAQTPAGGEATVGGAAPGGLTITPPSPIQPATGTGQVRQPPANSAMRRAGGAGTGSAAVANPMGMAGMSMTGTNALTLGSGGMSGQSGMQQGMGSGPDRNGRGQGAGTDQMQQGGNVRITDTGVTQRTPGNAARPR